MNFKGYKITDAELVRLVSQPLPADEGKRRARLRADGIDRVIYVCPECGISRLTAKGEYIRCGICNRAIKLLPSGELECEGAELPFSSIDGWYGYQEDFVRALPVVELADSPILCDTAAFIDVTTRRRNIILRKAALTLYANRIVVAAPNGEEIDFGFDTLSDVCLGGVCAVNIYYGDEVYQFKGRSGFCALKYVNLFYKYKSAAAGEKRAEYLGVEKE